MARPCRYTDDVAATILHELRRGRPLRAVCGDAGMPSARTVQQWVLRDRAGFAVSYRRARRRGRAGLGRAPTYSAALGGRILSELARGRTLIDVCRDHGMPAYDAVRDWVRFDRHGFAAPYRLALKVGGAKWARPTRYSACVADEILDGLCEGRTLEAVCSDPDMPTPAAVRLWVKQDRDDFAARYQWARWIGCETLGGQMVTIADGQDDWIQLRRADGTIETILDPLRIRRRTEQVKARYWLLSRLLRHVTDPLAPGEKSGCGK